MRRPVSTWAQWGPSWPSSIMLSHETLSAQPDSRTGRLCGYRRNQPRCDDCFEVQVIRIIDGDTLDTSRGVIRIYGVDTPEVGQRCASEATKRLKDLAGNTIRIEVGPRTADQYGRMLAYVYTVEGASIDAVLISEGLAMAWTRDGQHRDYLVGLEREARMQGAGVPLVSAGGRWDFQKNVWDDHYTLTALRKQCQI